MRTAYRERIARDPIQNVIERVAIRKHNQFSLFAVDIAFHQHRDLRSVPVMHIMRRKLKMPLQLAGIGVEREQAVRVKIVTLSYVAVPVRTGVAGAPIKEVDSGS